MTDKKSFVLYSDIIHSVELLTDEEAGQLFKHILRYVNNQNPTLDDRFLKVTFEPIKQNLKRDLVKYLKRVEVAKQNGKLGGRKPKKPTSVKSNRNKAVNDNVTDIDIAIDTDTVIVLPFDSNKFKDAWDKFKLYKKNQFGFTYKSTITEMTALSQLQKLSESDEKTALLILEQSVANGWKGIFKLKDAVSNKHKPSDDYLQNLKSRLQNGK